MRSASLLASSTSVGTSMRSGERCVTYCTNSTAFFSVSQFMRVVFIVFHDVNEASVSPRSTASRPSVEPGKPRIILNCVPATSFMSFG